MGWGSGGGRVTWSKWVQIYISCYSSTALANPLTQHYNMGNMGWGLTVGKSSFVNPENLGITFWRKNCVHYDKIENSAKLQKSQILPKLIFFFLPSYHVFKIVFTLFSTFTGYDDDIFQLISYLLVQRSKQSG